MMSASLIGLGASASGYPPLRCRCLPRARASLRNRHQGPSIMGFEDEADQSFGRPYREELRFAQCERVKVAVDSSDENGRSARFELATPSPPDWCANRAALRSDERPFTTPILTCHVGIDRLAQALDPVEGEGAAQADRAIGTITRRLRRRSAGASSGIAEGAAAALALAKRAAPERASARSAGRPRSASLTSASPMSRPHCS